MRTQHSPTGVKTLEQLSIGNVFYHNGNKCRLVKALSCGGFCEKIATGELFTLGWKAEVTLRKWMPRNDLDIGIRELTERLKTLQEQEDGTPNKFIPGVEMSINFLKKIRMTLGA